MKFLFICTKNSILDLANSLITAGHSVFVLENVYFDPNNSVQEQNTTLEHAMRQQHYNLVISYLFIPAVAELCFKYSIPYVSWTYDSPLNALFTPAVSYDTNYLFIFDRSEYLRLKAQNLPHLYYLPLAANTECINQLSLSATDEARYSHDIAFIGGLYNDNYYDLLFPHFPPEIQEELKQILSERLGNWSDVRTWGVVSEQCTNCIGDILHKKDWNSTSFLTDEEFAYLFLIPHKLAQLERITVLNTLANYFPVNLYTNDSSRYLQNVTVHPPVDYNTTARKIYALSKINLNITLPSIESGIPQRVFDAMACGGFVLTNYQEELNELFDIGQEIEVFHNLNELVVKVHYYLSHEQERLAIAINGYRKVCSLHSLSNRISKMTSILSTETGELL